jgi:hypothetical protein
LNGIFGSLLCSIPVVRESLIAIVGWDSHIINITTCYYFHSFIYAITFIVYMANVQMYREILWAIIFCKYHHFVNCIGCNNLFIYHFYIYHILSCQSNLPVLSDLVWSVGPGFPTVVICHSFTL